MEHALSVFVKISKQTEIPKQIALECIDPNIFVIHSPNFRELLFIL